MHTEEGGGSVAASTAFMLGESRSDVKNILLALPALRNDIKEVEERLSAVEKFNTRVLTIAGVTVPLLTFIVNFAINKLNIFGG
jgi:uncharacterized membrane protein